MIAMADLRVLEHELVTFDANRAALASEALGRYALVYGDEVVAIHDTEREAIADGRGRFGYVPILVERITAEGEANPPTNAVRTSDKNGERLMQPISWGVPPRALHHFGPVAMVNIGATEADKAAITHSGMAVPEPIRGGALIDTGATFSQIDDEIIAELGLQPVGILDVAGFDVIDTKLRYDVKLVFEDGMLLETLASGSQFRRPPDSPIPGYDALIGRDILASAILTYDGTCGRVSLQFRPPSLAAGKSGG
jgi:hypothetical protein